MKKLKNKNKIKEILYSRQYSPKKIKPKKGKGSFKRKKK
tara:strand:+ start:317 stop:433 length:117 start_codon:yes stop_codon:yes gene_type:complete